MHIINLIFDAQPNVGEIEANSVKMELIVPKAAMLLIPLQKVTVLR